MLKYTHYVLENFEPRLDAEIIEHKEDKFYTLNIWVGYDRKRKSEFTNAIQIIFSRHFDNIDDLKDIMDGFGHGFEYLGVRWTQI